MVHSTVMAQLARHLLAAPAGAPPAEEDPGIIATLIAWEVAVLFLGFVLVTVVWEFSIALLTFLTVSYTGRKALWVKCLKDEILVLGVITLTLAVIEASLANICIDGVEHERVSNAEYPDHHCPEGQHLLFTRWRILQTHLLLFAVACVFIVYTCTSLYICIFRLRFWRKWELQAKVGAATDVGAPIIFRRLGTSGAAHFLFMTLWHSVFAPLPQEMYTMLRLVFRLRMDAANLADPLPRQANFLNIVEQAMEVNFSEAAKYSWLLSVAMAIFLVVPIDFHALYWLFGLSAACMWLCAAKLQSILVHLSAMAYYDFNVEIRQHYAVFTEFDHKHKELATMRWGPRDRSLDLYTSGDVHTTGAAVDGGSIIRGRPRPSPMIRPDFGAMLSPVAAAAAAQPPATPPHHASPTAFAATTASLGNGSGDGHGGDAEEDEVSEDPVTAFVPCASSARRPVAEGSEKAVQVSLGRQARWGPPGVSDARPTACRTLSPTFSGGRPVAEGRVVERTEHELNDVDGLPTEDSACSRRDVCAAATMRPGTCGRSSAFTPTMSDDVANAAEEGDRMVSASGRGTMAQAGRTINGSYARPFSRHNPPQGLHPAQPSFRSSDADMRDGTGFGGPSCSHASVGFRKGSAEGPSATAAATAAAVAESAEEDCRLQSFPGPSHAEATTAGGGGGAGGRTDSDRRCLLLGNNAGSGGNSGLGGMYALRNTNGTTSVSGLASPKSPLAAKSPKQFGWAKVESSGGGWGGDDGCSSPKSHTLGGSENPMALSSCRSLQALVAAGLNPIDMRARSSRRVRPSWWRRWLGCCLCGFSVGRTRSQRGSISGGPRPSWHVDTEYEHYRHRVPGQLRDYDGKVMRNVDALFWFNKPSLLLWIFQLCYMENSMSLSILLYGLVRDLAGIQKAVNMAGLISLLVLDVLLLVFASTAVLPVYALINTAATNRLQDLIEEIRLEKMLFDKEEYEEGIGGWLLRLFRIMPSKPDDVEEQDAHGSGDTEFVTLLADQAGVITAFGNAVAYPLVHESIYSDFTRMWRAEAEQWRKTRTRANLSPVIKGDLSRFRKNFDWLDKDRSYDDEGSGYGITAKELAYEMRQLGTRCTMAELRDMIAQVDADGSGEVGFQEYVLFMCFKFFDHDNDGFLDIRDLAFVSSAVGEKPRYAEEMTTLIKFMEHGNEEADWNDGRPAGRVELDEFLRFFQDVSIEHQDVSGSDSRLVFDVPGDMLLLAAPSAPLPLDRRTPTRFSMHASLH